MRMPVSLVLRKTRGAAFRIYGIIDTFIQRSDFIYTILRYKRGFGRWPRLLRPRTFNEWIIRRMLFDRNPRLTMFADKCEVRQYVRERVGDKYLTQLYLVAESPEQIDFDRLPDRFVVKTTHGCGWNILVENKEKVDDQQIKHQCAQWLQQNYYDLGREWCYKNIRPRILVEEYLGNDRGEPPYDFKFFCFGGIARLVQVDVGRFGNHQRDFYDMDWNRLPVKKGYCDNLPVPLPVPDSLEEMVRVAQALAQGTDFVRVDLYNVNGRVYFGELTNYPGGGSTDFEPEEYAVLFGSYWPR